MGLAEFIVSNQEAILAEFEAFARTLLPAAGALDKEQLRDHAAMILSAIVADMKRPQTAHEQSEKSKGRAPRDPILPETASEAHGSLRAASGFDLGQTVSEFRALRASILRLWSGTSPALGPAEFDELTRFNEGMDQALAESLSYFAQAAARYRSLFLGVLSHELRTPLGTVVASAHSLLQAAEAQQTLPEAARRILRGGKRIESILTDLLDYVRSGAGEGIRVTPTPIRLDDLCDRIARDLEASYPGSRVEVQIDGDGSGAWDEQRLIQALSNLVSNAIKYGSKDVPVGVRVDGTSEDEVVISVSNAGPPIPQKTRESLFQPLVRGAGPDEAGLSLGLGLYIVREIATSHGGGAEIAASTDEGTVFCIRLPRTSDPVHLPAFRNLGMN